MCTVLLPPGGGLPNCSQQIYHIILNNLPRVTTAGYSETSVCLYHRTSCHCPEDSCRHENLHNLKPHPFEAQWLLCAPLGLQLKTRQAVYVRGCTDKSLARPGRKQAGWTDNLLKFFEWLTKVIATG